MIEAYPLAWPATWPRNQYPVASRFETTIAQARNNVLHELRLLGATEVVISSNAEINRYGDISGRQRTIEDTGVAVYFTLRGEQKCIPCDKFIRLQDNLKAVAKTIEALRGIERWGTHQIVDAAFMGFAALPAGSHWWEVLGVGQRATRDEIHLAFRRLAKAAHPDQGGDRAEWDRLKQAYDQAMAS